MAILSITDKAAEHMKTLLKRRGKPSLGLRFGTEQKGCSGLGYVVDFVDDPDPEDEVIEIKGVCIYIERASLVNIMGSKIDYEEGNFSSGFVFINPNEKSRCGCGESFNV
ncbi:MAG: iron-sulfur cluster assembly accessory protein [Proteobacteria bacterium]|nr:iron-sulfur cluster assembly accessory protein [Pseudomonadota bacterium]